MLRNYLKITCAVLMRRKFLTFVNLFGAALTVTVLVVAYALFDSFVNPSGAQHRQGRILTFSSLMLDGRPVSFLLTSPGFKLYENYVAPLETPDKTSFTLQPFETSSYVGGRKITSLLRVTDAAYWDILDFELIDGRLLAADDVDQGRFVAVINEATANIHFPGESALGSVSRASARQQFLFRHATLRPTPSTRATAIARNAFLYRSVGNLAAAVGCLKIIS